MIKKIKESVEIEVTEDCLCDKCGKSMFLPQTGEIYGLNAHFDTGYCSPVFPDATHYEFDLCEACLKELMGCFVIPATEEQIF